MKNPWNSIDTHLSDLKVWGLWLLQKIISDVKGTISQLRYVIPAKKKKNIYIYNYACAINSAYKYSFIRFKLVQIGL